MVVAGNPGSNGPFAPLVRAVRNVMGTKEFNKFRGKAISLHSQGKDMIFFNSFFKLKPLFVN